MITIVETRDFSGWMSALRDAKARNRIVAHIRRIELTGHFGGAKSVGDDVSELCFDFGPAIASISAGGAPTS